MIAGVLVDRASRWAVLAFASAHVLGLLTHHPVPWSATLTAVALLPAAATRSLAVLPGLAAATALIARTEYRGGGLGWPFFLSTPDTAAWPEAVLLTAAVLALSAAALLPPHFSLTGHVRTWYSERRTHVLDLLDPPPQSPAAPEPGILDLGVVTPFDGPHPSLAVSAPRRRPPLATVGTVSLTGLAVTVAALPLWLPDRWSQLTLLDTPDRTGLLLATVPLLLTVAAATITAGRLLLRPGPPAGRRWGVAVAAVSLAALTVPLAWDRGATPRFAPGPPPSVLSLHSYHAVEPTRPGGPPAAQVHPFASDMTTTPAGAWPFTWADTRDATVFGVVLAALIALIRALLTRSFRRPDTPTSAHNAHNRPPSNRRAKPAALDRRT